MTRRARAIRLYVGDYEARAMPIADTDPDTDAAGHVPDRRRAAVLSSRPVGAGFGHRKFSSFVLAGRAQELPLNLPRNLALGARPARVFSGDGVNLDKLGDDTEATNWASLDGVAGKRVTVDLAGDHAAAGQPGQRERAAAAADRRRRRRPDRRTGSARCGRSASRRATRRWPTARSRATSAASSPARPTRSRPATFRPTRVAAEPADVLVHAGVGDAPAPRGADQPVHRQPAVRR